MSDDMTRHIHEGREGWLFLTAGTNNVIGQFSDTPEMGRRLKAWKHIVTTRARRCRALRCSYLHVVVPEKLTVYDHKLANLRIDMRLSPALRLRRSLFWRPDVRRSCIDLVTAFRTRRDDVDLYFRTDSHWSLAGRLVAYREICAAVAAEAREDFAERPFTDQDFTGDLGARMDPPQTEPARFVALQRDSVRIHASPIVEAREAAGLAETLHIGAHVVYRNDAPNADPRRLVLFGDSYSHFAPSMLMIMLAETFREVHFIWSTSVDWSYVERVAPDLVVTQVAERFMFQIPNDAFDLEAYAAERFGEELAASPAQASA